MEKTGTIAGIMGGTAVMLGALGAHALKDILPPTGLDAFKTAVLYQMFHALALLGIIGLRKQLKMVSWLVWVQRCWIGGVVLFSGSIYGLTILGALGWPVKFLGPVTPLGGLTLMVGWLILTLGFFSGKSTKS
jgi:uncharacterized membrane protein YgdD (TMEM256/DUF423 family)